MLKQLAKWRIEHKQALAALRVIEASILDHEVDLEQLAEHDSIEPKGPLHPQHARHAGVMILSNVIGRLDCSGFHGPSAARIPKESSQGGSELRLLVSS